MADIARLEEMLGFLETHPELHNQMTWLSSGEHPPAWDLATRYPELTWAECNSTGCLAGWAAHFWGDNIEEHGNWESEGRKVLELTLGESIVLFHPRNTIDTLRQMVKDLANGLDLVETWEEKDVSNRGIYRPRYYRKGEVR